jgi:hypothetical protein
MSGFLIMFEAKPGLFSHNKFLDVVWFLNIYYYELLTASRQSSTGGLHYPLKTADAKSKARNNKYFSDALRSIIV